MPLYTYYCEKCKEYKELLCKANEKDNQFCSCGTKLKIEVPISDFMKSSERLDKIRYYGKKVDMYRQRKINVEKRNLREKK